MIPNYYGILGVDPHADESTIKQAYRRLAREHHPDVSSRQEDRQIKRVNEAYAVLSNPRKRAAYDARLIEALRRQQEKQTSEPKMSWAAGLGGFVREFQKELADEPKMSWSEGLGGFVREIKKGMRED